MKLEMNFVAKKMPKGIQVKSIKGNFTIIASPMATTRAAIFFPDIISGFKQDSHLLTHWLAWISMPRFAIILLMKTIESVLVSSLVVGIGIIKKSIKSVNSPKKHPNPHEHEWKWNEQKRCWDRGKAKPTTQQRI